MAADITMDGKGNYVYAASGFSNYDGDSIRCTITKTWDFGFNIHVSQGYDIHVRLRGVDTPELRDDRADYKAAAKLARDKVWAWLAGAAAAGDVIFLSQDKPDKYGRALGDFRRGDGALLSRYILDNHLGVIYEGQNKADVDFAHEVNISLLKKAGALS